MVGSVDELKDIFKNKGLSMSRVPDKTREEFLEFSKGEFADDRGMCFHYVWDCFKRFQQIINTQDIKLDYIIEMIKSQSSNSETKTEGRKMPKFLAPQLNSPEVKNEQT